MDIGLRDSQFEVMNEVLAQHFVVTKDKDCILHSGIHQDYFYLGRNGKALL